MDGQENPQEFDSEYMEKIVDNIDGFDTRVSELRDMLKAGKPLTMGKMKLLAKILEHQRAPTGW